MYLPEEAGTVQSCEEKTQGHLLHVNKYFTGQEVALWTRGKGEN